jgi:hypothetical protein
MMPALTLVLVFMTLILLSLNSCRHCEELIFLGAAGFAARQSRAKVCGHLHGLDLLSFLLAIISSQVRAHSQAKIDHEPGDRKKVFWAEIPVLPAHISR